MARLLADALRAAGAAPKRPQRVRAIDPVSRDQREADKAAHDGRGRRRPPKPVKAGLWAKSAADHRPGVYRTRLASRDASMAWRGKAQALGRSMTAAEYRRGKGLRRTPQAYALYVQGRAAPIGWLDDGMDALAWARAATDSGVPTRCYQEV